MPLRYRRSSAALAGSLLALIVPALAQQPSQEQISAIRSNCRSDFLSNCSGVPRGGAEAVRCLKDHLAKLSPGCHAAVSAITPPPAPKVAAPPPPPPPVAAPAASTATPAAPPAPATAAAPAAPTAPVASPAPPSAPPATQPSTASAPTAPTAPAAKARKAPPAPAKTAQPAAPQPPRAAAAAPPAVAPAPPPAAQPTSLGPIPPLRPGVRLGILRACKAAHQALCGNVPIGGGRIVECLAENGASLSPGCRDAILSAK